MAYVALRDIKVQTADGRTEIRRAGQPVPEAEGWAKPERWVNRRYIAVAEPTTQIVETPTKPKRVARRKVVVEPEPKVETITAEQPETEQPPTIDPIPETPEEV